MNKLVSVIIPCYQSELTLKKTLGTIFLQTYKPIEVIAVNDGSTDKTNEILKQYTKKITILNQKNKGASAARNKGFSFSHGEYIFFCDADVILDKMIISKMVEKLTLNKNAAYCYCNFKFGWHSFDLFPFDPIRLQKENYISTMSLIRRLSFIGFDESLKRFQDWDLWKRMLKKQSFGIWLPERLFKTTISRTGISKFNLLNNLKILGRSIKYIILK